MQHRLDNTTPSNFDFSNVQPSNSNPVPNGRYHPLTPSSMTSSSSGASRTAGQGQQQTAPPPRPPPVNSGNSSPYTQSYIRNKWNNDGAMDARGAENQTPPVVPARTNGSASPANASISLTVSNVPTGSSIASKSPTPRLDENENGQKSEEEEPTVVEESTALIGSLGGVIRCEKSNVELRIPAGAITEGQEHEIYVKVCREGDSSPIDRSKGETLLSPLVMCGPQGLKFEKQCELRMPHTGPVTADSDGQWSFSLKTGEGGEWKHMEIEQQQATNANLDQFLTVPITHF